MSCGTIGFLLSRSRSHQRFNMSVNVCFDDILWTAELLCYQAWYGDAESLVKVSCGEKKLFTIFMVKVTARAHMIKIWLFLLYLLPGNQTWSDDTSSQVRVFCEEKKLLHSRSRSQWRVKMSMFVQMSKLAGALSPVNHKGLHQGYCPDYIF